jgi:hypothetical protein
VTKSPGAGRLHLKQVFAFEHSSQPGMVTSHLLHTALLSVYKLTHSLVVHEEYVLSARATELSLPLA